MCDVREIEAGDGDQLEKIHHEPPDIVVAIGTTAFKKVKELKGLPIVYLMVVSSEIDQALYPNISGVSMDVAPGASFAAMKDMLPNAKRVGLLYDTRHLKSFVRMPPVLHVHSGSN